ncbi:MAG: MBOAT family O-acyltransferase [Ruthenibacterium sp.]
MAFQSVSFFALFFVTLCVYYAVPSRYKNATILCASIVFYAATGFGYLVMLFAAILLSYSAARLLAAAKTQSRRKAILATSLVVFLGNLCFFKYYDAFGKTLMRLCQSLGLPVFLPDTGLLAPLGISFYTFTVLAYLIDIYREKQTAEVNFIRYAAFISFFPLVASGPIERGRNLLPQFDGARPFVYETFCKGASRMLWGFFKKFVVANTIAGMVDAVFVDVTKYTGPYLLLAALLYSYQLYCDFSGYSDIAIGAAQMLCMDVMENFTRPFAAHSYSDLWRRWHISLTSWFREYLYFPLGGSRKGAFRTVCNILIIFLVSGIWHGSGLTFAVWGLLNGIYMAIGRASAASRAKLAEKNPLYRNKTLRAIVQITCVYLLFTSCIVFFRAENMADALYVYTHLFTGWVSALTAPAGVIATLKTMGIGRVTGLLLLVTIGFTEILEWRAAVAKQKTGAYLRAQKPAVRMTLYYAMLILLALFGVLGKSSFIYFQF